MGHVQLQHAIPVPTPPDGNVPPSNHHEGLYSEACLGGREGVLQNYACGRGLYFALHLDESIDGACCESSSAPDVCGVGCDLIMGLRLDPHGLFLPSYNHSLEAAPSLASHEDDHPC